MSLQELAVVAERVMREYDSLAKMSLKDWACDVRATLEPWGGRGEQYDLQTLRDFASMLHQRLAGPPDESRRLDFIFREYCEADRGCWLEEEGEAFLAEMETLWASLDELRESFPDLPLLLCLEFDEAKSLIARRIVRQGLMAGRAALACHRVPLRTKLARVTERMELIVATGAVVRSGCTVRPLPAELPERVRKTLEAVKASKVTLTGD